MKIRGSRAVGGTWVPRCARLGLLVGLLCAYVPPALAQSPVGLPKSLKPSAVELADALDRLRGGWRGAELAVEGEGAVPLAVGEELVRRVRAPLKLIGAADMEPEGALALKESLASTEVAIRSLAAAAARGEAGVDTTATAVQRVVDAYLHVLTSHLRAGVLPAGAENR